MVDYQVHPAKQTPQAEKSTTESWATESIPAETVYLVLYPTGNMHIVCNTSSSPNGLQDGTLYAFEQTHIIECRGATHLHVTNESGVGSGTLYWTARHN